MTPRVYVRSFDYVEKEETIAADIRKASVVLMPSRREGFGLVGLEAISAAVPVLVSDRSGLGEVLCDHGTPSARRAVVQTSGVDDDPDIAAWKLAARAMPALAKAAEQDLACAMCEKRLTRPLMEPRASPRRGRAALRPARRRAELPRDHGQRGHRRLARGP